MGQLNFAINNFIMGNNDIVVSVASLTFCPINIIDNISWKTINIPYTIAGGSTVSKSISFSIGLYSLNNTVLSLANSAFKSETNQYSGQRGGYIVITSTSATQNITPGTWWIGYLISSSAQSGTMDLIGQSTNISAANAFPGSFIGGRMTDSTNALPASYATSNLDITGQDAFSQPIIILTA